jgi:hypothetical protein
LVYASATRLIKIGPPMTSGRVRCLTSSKLNFFYRQVTVNNASHHCLTLGIGGKLHLAPIDTSKITVSKKEEMRSETDLLKKALDIGTGTGM